MQDGDLLALIVSHISNVTIRDDKFELLLKVINELELSNFDFEWSNQKIKDSFQNNTAILKGYITLQH